MKKIIILFSVFLIFNLNINSAFAYSELVTDYDLKLSSDVKYYDNSNFYLQERLGGVGALKLGSTVIGGITTLVGSAGLSSVLLGAGGIALGVVGAGMVVNGMFETYDKFKEFSISQSQLDSLNSSFNASIDKVGNMTLSFANDIQSAMSYATSLLGSYLGKGSKTYEGDSQYYYNIPNGARLAYSRTCKNCLYVYPPKDHVWVGYVKLGDDIVLGAFDEVTFVSSYNNDLSQVDVTITSYSAFNGSKYYDSTTNSWKTVPGYLPYKLSVPMRYDSSTGTRNFDLSLLGDYSTVPIDTMKDLMNKNHLFQPQDKTLTIPSSYLKSVNPSLVFENGKYVDSTTKEEVDVKDIAIPFPNVWNETTGFGWTNDLDAVLRPQAPSIPDTDVVPPGSLPLPGNPPLDWSWVQNLPKLLSDILAAIVALAQSLGLTIAEVLQNILSLPLEIVKALFTALVSALDYLFIPRQDVIVGAFEPLKDSFDLKFPVFAQIKGMLSNVAFDTCRRPEIIISIPEFLGGGQHDLLDYSFVDKFRPLLLSFQKMYIYLIFAIHVFKKLPNVISGGGDSD